MTKKIRKKWHIFIVMWHIFNNCWKISTYKETNIHPPVSIIRQNEPPVCILFCIPKKQTSIKNTVIMTKRYFQQTFMGKYRLQISHILQKVINYYLQNHKTFWPFQKYLTKWRCDKFITKTRLFCSPIFSNVTYFYTWMTYLHIKWCEIMWIQTYTVN